MTREQFLYQLTCLSGENNFSDLSCMARYYSDGIPPLAIINAFEILRYRIELLEKEIEELKKEDL